MNEAMKATAAITALGLAVVALIVAVTAVLAGVVLAGLGLGARAVWTLYVDNYQRTHGRRISGGIGRKK